MALMAPTSRTQPMTVGSIFAGIIDPKRTRYHGILMRSRLEAAFARYLDSEGIAWRYEPELFGPPGQAYLPDFMLPRPDGPHYVEVKPTLREVPLAQERMTVIWHSRPDAALVVACGQDCQWFACEKGGEWITWTQRWSHA